MGLEEQLLTASIADTIFKAREVVSRLFRLYYDNTTENINDEHHANRLSEAKLTLSFYVEKAFRDTSILAERLGLPLLRDDIAKLRRSFKTIDELVPDPFDVEFRSEPLEAVLEMYNSLATMTEGRGLTGLSVFETVLENTPKIIDAAQMSPSNEAEVRAEVRKVLGFCFRDVVREIPISKSIKVYKPDIGVLSLMAAAEYKFIDSQAEAKKALDETYADMKGYSGRYDWRSFYAVFYMTAPFYSQKDVDGEYRLVRAELSWTPIVVVGAGGRTTKPTKTARRTSSKKISSN
jgi:hypothetical protein